MEELAEIIQTIVKDEIFQYAYVKLLALNNINYSILNYCKPLL
jgi:hypothetical protein